MAEVRVWWKNSGVNAALAVAAALIVPGCAAQRAAKTTPAPEPPPIQTPYVVPTVPPGTPTPVTSAPLPTRPLEDPAAEKAKAAGKAIGPVVTHAGVARADGRPVESMGKEKGIPVYLNYVGSGFLLVIEAKPGLSRLEVGRRIFAYDENNPAKRPDLEVQVNRTLGDGSPAVCDNRKPKIGGIPAIDPPSFAETKEVSATLNDMSCRFETFIESAGSCTLNKQGDFSFVAKDTVTQFCMVVAKAWNFPVGDTLVSVRLRDSKGEPGPISQFIVRRPSSRPTPSAAERKPTPNPTPARRRP
jgi:hypothetical protein